MRSRLHLTYANVMATLGVFIALGGGAYAVSTKAPKDSVNSKAIVDGSVKGKDVKDDSLTGADIDQSTLSSGAGGSGGPPSGPAGGDLAGNYPKPQLAPGAAIQNLSTGSIDGDKLGNGAVTATKLGRILVASNSARDATSVTARCPDGTQLISGGGDANGAPLTRSEASNPFGSEGFRSWGTSTYPQTASSIYAYAYCLKG